MKQFMMRLGNVVLLSLFSVSLFASAVDETLEQRIAPIGSLCMAGDECASAVQLASSDGPRSGDQIYNTKCAACHASGAAGAPRTGDVDAWVPRLAKGVDVLYVSAIKGLGGMPAGGLCGPKGCSEDEIKAAVDHMLEASK